MQAFGQLVVFTMEGQRFAVPLPSVLRVLPAVAVTPVPEGPAVLMGIFELHGELVPVLDRRLRSADSIALSDHFVVLRTARRTLALLVDDVVGVADAGLQPLDRPQGMEAFQGTTRLEGDLVLIHDVERFLSPQESQQVERALEAAR